MNVFDFLSSITLGHVVMTFVCSIVTMFGFSYIIPMLQKNGNGGTIAPRYMAMPGHLVLLVNAAVLMLTAIISVVWVTALLLMAIGVSEGTVWVIGVCTFVLLIGKSLDR